MRLAIPGVKIRWVSPKVKGASSRMATLPARLSEMELISSGELEPVFMNLPGCIRLASTATLRPANSSGRRRKKRSGSLEMISKSLPFSRSKSCMMKEVVAAELFSHTGGHQQLPHMGIIREVQKAALNIYVPYLALWKGVFENASFQGTPRISLETIRKKPLVPSFPRRREPRKYWND